MKILIKHAPETSINDITKLVKDVEKSFASKITLSDTLEVTAQPYEKRVRDISKFDAVILIAPAFSRTLSKEAYYWFQKCSEHNVPVYTRALRVLAPCDVHRWQIKNMSSKVCLGETCLVKINYVDELNDNGINTGARSSECFVARFPCMTC